MTSLMPSLQFSRSVEKDSLASHWHPPLRLVSNGRKVFGRSFSQATATELRVLLLYLSNRLEIQPKLRSAIQTLLTESRADYRRMEERLILIDYAWELQKLRWFPERP